MNQRLSLGTAQFGLPYGIANATGQVARSEVGEILARASAAGLDSLDTAIGYGDSEQRLGEFDVSEWRIVSKLPSIPPQCANIEAWAHACVDGTLSRLHVQQLYGLLLHRPLELCGPRGPELRRALESVRATGKAARIGVSIYSPGELDLMSSAGFFDLVQAPFNVLDRRLQTSGWLARLSAAGTEVHVRSVFLQGLLLMKSSDRPVQFRRWQSLWDKWDGWLNANGLTPLAACLLFVLSQPLFTRAIVGVDSVEQLDEILGTSSLPPTVSSPELSSEDLDLINPSLWRSN